ncbi:MAG: hypothetical protein ACI9KE_006657, partial [Polyangiales bacterium]
TEHSMKRLALLLLPALAVLSAPANASAQSLDGTFRLGVDLSFFQFQRQTIENGGGSDLETDTSVFSLLSQELGLVAGVNLSERFFLGGRLVLARTNLHVDPDSRVGLTWEIGPVVEYRFLDSGIFRPFGNVGLFFGGDSVKVGDAKDNANFLGFRFGVGGNIFIADSFSIDPRLEFDYRFQIGADDGAGQSRWNVGLIVALTGWIGGSPSAGSNNTGFRAGSGESQSVTEVTEVIDLGSDVLLTLVGTPGMDSMDIRLQRRGSNAVLAQCSELAWQVDGAAARMPVAYASEDLSGGVAETLSNRTASNNATLLGNARVVTLTVCGASFTMTPAQLAQLGDFSRRLNATNYAPQQQQDAWPPRAY